MYGSGFGRHGKEARFLLNRVQENGDERWTRTHLTCSQDSAHFANDGLITAEIGAPLEHKTDIVTEIVTLVLSTL